MDATRHTKIEVDARAQVRVAAHDQQRVRGVTHCFYRYPARFSPVFARACINAFTRPGDLVLDPYMGGGTTVVEAYLAGRRAIGSDLNSLAVFIARVKTSRLSTLEMDAISKWATENVPALRCTLAAPIERLIPKNMTWPYTRWLRKTISLCLQSANEHLPTTSAKEFARCILLNVGQWALNGRKQIPSSSEFREQLSKTALEMLTGASELARALDAVGYPTFPPLTRENDAESIDSDAEIVAAGVADLVVTSPPYPGIHMLYHRWQVDGRKETDAPYWIAQCNDGEGSSFYNFADRKRHAHDRYFEKAQRSFSSVRRLVRSGAVLAQMVAFSEPTYHLPRYLDAMKEAGFRELRAHNERRIWRSVPGRKWHARSKGATSSAREVALLHEAV